VPETAGIFAALDRLGEVSVDGGAVFDWNGDYAEYAEEFGVRPLIEGVTLWIVVASVSLWAIHLGWIAL
jgi:hypothetical protein